MKKHCKYIQFWHYQEKKRFQKTHFRRTGCSIQATAIATTVTMKASLIFSVSLILVKLLIIQTVNQIHLNQKSESMNLLIKK